MIDVLVDTVTKQEHELIVLGKLHSFLLTVAELNIQCIVPNSSSPLPGCKPQGQALVSVPLDCVYICCLCCFILRSSFVHVKVLEVLSIFLDNVHERIIIATLRTAAPQKSRA